MHKQLPAGRIRGNPKLGRLLAGLVVVVVIGGLGTTLLLTSHAATSVASVETENGAVSSAASKVSDATASNSSAVKFGTGTGGGGGTGTDPLCAWPGIANHAFPCAADTGYPAGTALHTSGCPATLSTAGATYDGCEWTDTLVIQAANITIKNSLITGGSNEAIQCSTGCSNVTVTYTTIDYRNYLNGGTPAPEDPSMNGCNGNDAVNAFGGTLILDHIHLLGWSDGPRWGGNNTIQNSYFEGCGFYPRDHCDLIQAYGGDAGNVANHNTLSAGNTNSENCADLSFSADGSAGQTYNNNFLYINASNVANSDMRALDIRGDDMSGTETVTNNVFSVGNLTPINCTQAKSGFTYVFSGNKLIDGTAYNPSCS